VKYRKLNSRSFLQSLPEGRAAMIEEYAKTHTLNETVAWLSKSGWHTSSGSLSRWLCHRIWQQCFKAAESSAEVYRDWLAKSFPKLSERELDRRASLMFQFKAMKSGDAKTYLALATARHKTRMDKARLDQRERAMAQAREKWLAAQKTKIEAGLDALFLEVKDNPEARELFQKFKTVVTQATA